MPSTRTSLKTAEGQSGARRKATLTDLVTKLTMSASTAGDVDKVKTAAAAVTDLANATK